MSSNRDEYTETLIKQFGHLNINLVKHDLSAGGLPCYIEVHLEEMPKDKGSVVLDLGNYIYRQFGLSYQMTPEYRGSGKNTTLRWFMSWKDVAPIQAKICECFNSKVIAPDWLPIEFYTLPIQVKPIKEQVALWKKTGELVIYRTKTSGSEIVMQVGKKEFIYLDWELGPISDFEILEDL